MKAPDKGSFPLDHFKECDLFAKQYTECLQKHELLPKKCRKYQREYLECRMNKGLMDREEMSKLGFTEESSWESEEQEKKYLFNKIQQLKFTSIKTSSNNFNSELKEEFEKQQQGMQQQQTEDFNTSIP